MAKSNPSPSASKPAAKLEKPSPDFALNIHKGSGYWCKKVRGRVHYFGKVADDPKGTAALEEWYRVKDDLQAGREPRPKGGDPEALTVADLCNEYLTHHEDRRDSGEISPRTFQTLHATCTNVVKVFGKTRAVSDLQPADFGKLRADLAKRRGNTGLRNEIGRVRSVFKFAFENGLILHPVRFGTKFSKPALSAVRRDREQHRAKHGDRMFDAPDIQRILDGASQPLRTMVLLAVNCGFGQSDLANLPLEFVHLDEGWIDYPRPKTGIGRRCWLWPETVAAIREWLPERPKAKDKADAGLLFLTVRGGRWVKTTAKGAPIDAVGQEFGKVLNRLKLKRPGVSFYALRHTFETIAGDTADQVAVDHVMGHVPHGMAAAYRERIDDVRLREVAEHVRSWLYAVPADGDGEPAGTETGGTETASPEPEHADTEAPTLRLFVG